MVEQMIQHLIHSDVLPRTNDNSNSCFSRVLAPLSGIQRLEIRTALQLCVNILPFWICTFPLSCCTMALYWCIRLKLNCSIIFIVIPYLRDMFLVHVIYNPICNMSTNAEFQRAVVHLFRKLQRKLICVN